MESTPDSLGNEYAPPRASIGQPAPELTDFFELFLQWEKYRLFYNLILSAETIVCLLALKPGSGVIVPIVLYAIAANICFCAGLVLNGYACQMGMREDWVGQALFAAGTGLAVLLTGIILLTMTQARFNGF